MKKSIIYGLYLAPNDLNLFQAVILMLVCKQHSVQGNINKHSY